MYKLNRTEVKKEIKRIEDRSIFYIKLFAAFWAGLIFFTIREIDTR